MKLTLASILYKIKRFNPILFLDKEFLKKELYGIKQFYIYDEALSVDYIYILNISMMMESLEEKDKNLTYICINDINIDSKTVKELGLKIILIKGEFPLPYVMNNILEMYDELKNWDKNMHIGSLEGMSPQVMIDLSEGIIEYPLIIFDSSFNVIAYTKHISTDYELFNKTVRSGYTHSDIIKKVQKEKVFSLLNESNAPVVKKAAGSDDKTNIYLKIKGGGVLFAYSCIFCGDHEPEQGYIDIMKYFFENLTLYYKQNYKNLRYGNLMYENFITGLISNKEISVEKVEEQLKYTEGISMYGPFVLGQIQFPNTGSIPIPFLARELDGLIVNAKPFIYQNQLYLLRKIKAFKEDGFLSKSEVAKLTKVLENFEYCCGISVPFEKITDIRFANLQCQKAIKFGRQVKKEDCGFFRYEDYSWYHILENTNSEMPLKIIQSYEYKCLKKHDIEHETEYLKLIITYLKNSNNTAQTSRELFLHRNTVLYSIKKVEEILNVSFDNFYTRQDFIFADQIDKYLESL